MDIYGEDLPKTTHAQSGETLDRHTRPETIVHPDSHITSVSTREKGHALVIETKNIQDDSQRKITVYLNETRRHILLVHTPRDISKRGLKDLIFRKRRQEKRATFIKDCVHMIECAYKCTGK